MNAVKNLFFRFWRPALLILSLALLAYLLYFHRLGTLLPGYSDAEINTLASANDWHTIVNNPLDAPYKVVLWLLTAVLHHGILATRVVSAIFGIIGILFFFAIIRPWFSYRVAFLGTILFATSAGFLHVSRLGTPEVLKMGVLAFLMVILWYRRHQEKRGAIGYLVVFICALLCYIPGLLWFELLGFGLLFQGVRRNLRQTSAIHVVGYSLLFLATLLPLIIAGSKDTHVLLAAAGLPNNLHAFQHFGINFIHGLTSIGLRSDGNTLFWVGHAPLLSIIELTLFVMGIYYYVYRERSVRTLYMTGAILISLVLIGINGNAGFAFLVPLVYLFIVSGLNQLIHQWLSVFPRNPFARFTGLLFVCMMLSFSILYQVRSYFIAWPHNTAVQATFNHKRDQ